MRHRTEENPIPVDRVAGTPDRTYGDEGMNDSVDEERLAHNPSPGVGMPPIRRVYGIPSWKAWIAKPTIRNLSPTTADSGTSKLLSPVTTITSYLELMQIVAFLAVMNKNVMLLFRGQVADNALLPALHRPQRQGGRGADLTPLERWRILTAIDRSILPALKRYGLPRFRHLESHTIPFGRWAVIQHYECWPTPMLDFSSSLRVAASFAFGPERKQAGYLYVTGTPRLRSDLMPLREKIGDDRDERREGVLAVRLNSVCPPRATRPHLQEGVLLSRYPLRGAQDLEPEANDFGNRIIAKFRLEDAGDFWSPPDFPCHSKKMLLPWDALSDELLARTDLAISRDTMSRADLEVNNHVEI